MNELDKKETYTNQSFEDIKHIDEDGIEYGYARELQLVLNYKEWRKFENVIYKAKESCKNSDITVIEHFVDIDKTIKELGGTMPEDLPTPKKSLKQLEKENKKSLKKK